MDAAKAAMFKINKVAEPILKALVEDKLIKSYKLKIEPFNGGFMLNANIKWDWSEENGDLKEKIYKVLQNNPYIYPGAFFQSYLDEGNSAQINSNTPNGKSKSYSVKDKKDIKPAVDDFMNNVIAEFKKIKEMGE